MNIAMWSGPRNLSTAMMVSFAQRRDCAVVDEPFYAAYLQATGLVHPMREAIISDGETDPSRVVDFCVGSVPEDKTVFYQKHMTHHMIPEFDREWISRVRNVFLIRDPSRVIASYHIKREDPTLTDIGIVEQVEIFERISDMTGEAPIVIDSADILGDPEQMLGKLCRSLGLSFDKRMLHWLAGPKPYDGIWAKHWYGSVWESTGFGSPSQVPPVVPESLQGVAEEAQQYFQRIKAYALTLDLVETRND